MDTRGDIIVGVGVLGGIATSTYLVYLYTDREVRMQAEEGPSKRPHGEKWVAADYVSMLGFSVVAAIVGGFTGAIVGVAAREGVNAATGRRSQIPIVTM